MSDDKTIENVAPEHNESVPVIEHNESVPVIDKVAAVAEPAALAAAKAAAVIKVAGVADKTNKIDTSKLTIAHYGAISKASDDLIEALDGVESKPDKKSIFEQAKNLKNAVTSILPGKSGGSRTSTRRRRNRRTGKSRRRRN
jgi:hypothetical protein